MYLSKCRNYGHGKLLRTLKISGAAWGWAVLLETKPKGYQPTKQPPKKIKASNLDKKAISLSLSDKAMRVRGVISTRNGEFCVGSVYTN